jgi:hypothetical protein
MDNEFEDPGDSPWQSIRLGFGAVLLILSGLGLFMAETRTHTTSAQSALSRSL